MTDDRRETSLAFSQTQRSHILLVLSNSTSDRESAFLEWYKGAYRQAVSNVKGVLHAQHYEQHEVDITRGQWAPPPFRYLGLYELMVDGAEAAAALIDRIAVLHAEQVAAETPATWLYYPASEKVGYSPASLPSMLTIAFANSVPGQEPEFREWYATRHIRHALNIPALVSGQTFERTQFQKTGAMDAIFSTIAIYEQEGTPEDIVRSFTSLPGGMLHFPMLDLDRSRFAEWAYRPV